MSVSFAKLSFLVLALMFLVVDRPSSCLELIDDKFVYRNFQDHKRDTFLHNRFKKGFAWGVATSAYQIEGGWNEDGKGPSIWDTCSHQGGHVFMNHTGDVACDSYHKIAEDVAILKDLGVTYYRFSVSWSRLLPDGTLNHPVNKHGLAYYHKLIDALINANIEPVVTLFHFDLPQALQDIGGFENRQTVQHFLYFADFCFREFGQKVKYWVTINEPYVYVLFGHEYGLIAPNLKLPSQRSFNIAHNLILAHARAWKRYHERYGQEQQGLVGMAFSTIWAEPMTQKAADLEAANLFMQMTVGWFARPHYHSDYPDEMKEYIEKHTDIKLPEFSPQEKEQILTRSCDFYGLNHYMTVMVKERGNEMPGQMFDPETVRSEIDRNWIVKEGYYTIVPWGIRKALNWIHKHFHGPAIIVTENGMPHVGYDVNLEDQDRVEYMTAYINEVMKAQLLDGVDVRGYFAWSLMDNFEWTHGYMMRFGLHYVNFTDPARPRMARASAKAYTEIIQDNGFPSKVREDL
ncbi:cytosolic beta-glucosidase-like [Ptychodera flava]|uniref:cytosolic beta-glucosidase-like n=1 Tax=Ptychodera flava TaxID=63121 RepID=UPI003969EE4C